MPDNLVLVVTLLEAITEGYLLATGKSNLPLTGSAKYNRLVGLAKKFYRDWQTEPGVDWNSLYSTVGAGTVSAGNTFDLDTEIIKVSQRDGDFIRIDTTDSNTIRFNLVPASTLYRTRYNNAVAHVGTTLVFSHNFTSVDQEFGGTILVPAFIRLDDLVNLADDVLIDNPAWLPVMIAAQYVLSDAQLSYQYPDLINQAQDLMTGMKLANNTQDDNYTASGNFFSNGDYYDGCEE